MRRLGIVALGALAALGITGCSVAPSPLNGLFYTSVKYPSYYPGADSTGPGPKKGQAQASAILGLVATGDASVDAACRAGGIRKINTVDEHAMSILGLYATYTTVVTGE